MKLPHHLALALALAACGPSPPDGGATDGSTGANTSSSGGTTGTGAGATTEVLTTGATTGTSTATTTDAAATGDSTTHSFIIGPDFPSGPTCVPPGSNLVAKECDPWVQDCPPAEKCVPYSGDGNADPDSMACRPIARDPVPIGGPCEVAGAPHSGCDDCEKGAICWPVDPDTNTGECVAQCKGSPDAPDCSFVPGTGCWLAFDGVVQICLPLCDPLEPACGEDEVCIPGILSDQFMCIPDRSDEAGQIFDSCTAPDACAPGLLCVAPHAAVECDPRALGCCVPFCDLDAPVCPGAGQACQPWFDDAPAPPGLEDLGICGLP